MAASVWGRRRYDLAAAPSAIFLIGGLGVGKTELAMNLACGLARRRAAGSVHLLDVDIVNPYFRLRKLKNSLSAAGVTVVTPGERVAASDLPALPVGVWGALEREELQVICDVGGDVVGMRPLARLRALADRRRAAVWFVANPMRPGTRHPGELAAQFRMLADYCTLTPTAVIANPHLQDDTTPELFAAGLAVVERFAAEVGLPVELAMVDEALVGANRTDPLVDDTCTQKGRAGACGDDPVPVLPIHRHWRTAWALGADGNEEGNTWQNG